MTISPIETSQARRDEWARVNRWLPWNTAPDWARFALRQGTQWYWMERPPYIENGKARPARKPGQTDRIQAIEPQPLVSTAEHLFRRPGPPTKRDNDSMQRLLACNVPIPVVVRCMREQDPEGEALKAYARAFDVLRQRYGMAVNNALEQGVAGCGS